MEHATWYRSFCHGPQRLSDVGASNGASPVLIRPTVRAPGAKMLGETDRYARSDFVSLTQHCTKMIKTYATASTLLSLEAGIAYRIVLCQNRRFISLPGGIRTHDPSVTDKAILLPSVPVERCPSRHNRTSRSGALNEFMKSLGTCLWHVPRGRHRWLPKGSCPPNLAIDIQSLSRIRPLACSCV